MDFSQSFAWGENTLNQLDAGVNCPRTGSNVTNNNVFKPPNRERSHKMPNSNSKTTSSDFGNQSPTVEEPIILDSIEESPTEKVHCKSIRERLRNASTSKKHDRKHMRRSRSDPITSSESKVSHSSSTFHKHGFTEDFGTMFDSTMEWHEPVERSHKNPKVKLDEKFEDDDFDQLFGGIQTPSAPAQKTIQMNETKNSSLIALSDSDEMEHVNVSELERLILTENVVGDTSGQKNDQDEILWEDSAFFNDLIASQQNTVQPEEDKNEADSLAEVVVDAEYISMRSGHAEGVEDEMESCFLEVSMQLSDLNKTEAKSLHATGTQLDLSISFTSVKEKTIADEVNSQNNGESNNSIVPWAKKVGIDSLSEWNCSVPIIKSYKKKGIQKMFEWQAECLSNPKVIFELFKHFCCFFLCSDEFKQRFFYSFFFIIILFQIKNGTDNLLYSAPTSAGKTFVSEILMFQTVLQRQKKVIIILPFISVVREKMYSLQVGKRELNFKNGLRIQCNFHL